MKLVNPYNIFAKRLAILMQESAAQHWWDDDESRGWRGNSRENDSRKNWWVELRADPIRFEAYRAKLRAAKARNPVWNKGVPCREETKAKLSNHFKGRSNVKLIGRKRPDMIGNKFREGTHHSAEHRAYMSRIMKGRAVVPPESRPRGENHHNYGKPAPKGSGNGHGSYCLKGHWVRSTWERGVADWLYLNGHEYEYESELFDLGGGLRYRPDFHLTDRGVWLEVKGYKTAKSEEKAKRFRELGRRLHIVDKSKWEQFQQSGSLRWAA